MISVTVTGCGGPRGHRSAEQRATFKSSAVEHIVRQPIDKCNSLTIAFGLAVDVPQTFVLSTSYFVGTAPSWLTNSSMVIPSMNVAAPGAEPVA